MKNTDTDTIEDLHDPLIDAVIAFEIAVDNYNHGLYWLETFRPTDDQRARVRTLEFHVKQAGERLGFEASDAFAVED